MGQKVSESLNDLARLLALGEGRVRLTIRFLDGEPAALVRRHVRAPARSLPELDELSLDDAPLRACLAALALELKHTRGTLVVTPEYEHGHLKWCDFDSHAVLA